MNPQFVEDRVRMPALGLIATAIVGLLMHTFGAAIYALSLISSSVAVFVEETGSLSMLFDAAGGLLVHGIGIVMGIVVLIGGIRMRRLSGRGFAMFASVIAILPCSPCCFLGLPVGLWSLVTLSDPQVRDAFESNLHGLGY